MAIPEVKSSSAKDPTKNKKGQGDHATRDWRFGPAKLWYDLIGLPEDAQTLDYGFKLKVTIKFCYESGFFKITRHPVQDAKSESLSSGTADDFEPPEDAFLMVSQEHWEDKVLWDIPYTPAPPLSGMGGTWKPLSETSASYSRQLSAGHSTTEGGVSSDSGPHQSMFPIENYELAYYRWEDDIIWDTEAMEQIPAPTLPLIDPNDSNFIIGIPEEPPPTFGTDRENRKVVPD